MATARKVRTQVQVDPDVYERLRRDAKARDVSVSYVVREALAQYYVRSGKGSARKALAALDAITGVIRGDGRNVAEEHDRVLNEGPRW